MSVQNLFKSLTFAEKEQCQSLKLQDRAKYFLD